MEAYHILIVEDDKEIREGIEIYLKNQGYSVTQAADGVEGLKKIEAQEFHLAIVDIMMPRMDGITMMMKVREKGGRLCDKALHDHGAACARQLAPSALPAVSRRSDRTGKPRQDTYDRRVRAQ